MKSRMITKQIYKWKRISVKMIVIFMIGPDLLHEWFNIKQIIQDIINGECNIMLSIDTRFAIFSILELQHF